MLFTIYVFLILIGLFMRAGKWYNYTVIIFLCLLLLTSEGRADYGIYSRWYATVNEVPVNLGIGTNFGWTILGRLGKLFNLSLDLFLSCILIISLLLVFSTITKYVDEYGITSKIIALFLIFPVLIDIIQIRYFLALSIFIFATRFIITNKRRDTITFIVLLFISFCIHSIMIVFFVFLLSKVLNERTRKFLPLIMLFLTVIFFILRNNISIITSIASYFVDEHRISYYIINPYRTPRPETIVACFAFFVLNYIFVNYAYKQLLRIKNEPEFSNDKEILFTAFVYDCNILIFVILPFIFFTNDFSRYPRGLFLLNCIVFMIDVFYEKRNKWLKTIIYSTYAVFLNVGFISMFNFDNIIIPLFSYNGLNNIFR